MDSHSYLLHELLTDVKLTYMIPGRSKFRPVQTDTKPGGGIPSLATYCTTPHHEWKMPLHLELILVTKYKLEDHPNTHERGGGCHASRAAPSLPGAIPRGTPPRSPSFPPRVTRITRRQMPHMNITGSTWKDNGTGGQNYTMRE